MRFIKALVALYVSLWKAWSLPEPSYTLQRQQFVTDQPPYRRVYDQEVEDDTYHDHDWEWPEVPEQQNRVPSTALMRVFNPDREWAEYSQSIEYHQFVHAAKEGR